jgi:Galactosyltransferase
MVKLAVCVKSCHRDLDAGFHEAIRGTWGRDAKALGIDVFFFVGKDPTQQDTRRVRRYVNGEVVLDCDDSYEYLPVKTRRICQWLAGKVFSHLFLCDTDTFVRPKLLTKTGFELFDYMGDFFDKHPGQAPFVYKDERGNTLNECRAWASGGFGYFLSRRAADIVAATPPRFWAEDLYVGNVLAPAIDQHMLKAQSIKLLGERNAPTEHWPKTTVKINPELIRLAYQNGGFRELYVKGILVA